MGKPIITNNTYFKQEGCTPISSNCVIWSGPDIDCINICNGDSITPVIYQLALKVCEMIEGVIDIEDLDTACMLDEGEEAPDTYTALVQMIIDKICDIRDNCCEEEEGGGAVTETPIPLPECLWYVDEEDETITELLPTEYAEYLALKICEGLDSIKELTAYYNNTNARLTALEEQFSEFSGECNIEVVTQCLSSETPGEEIPIAEAFTYMEDKLCDYIGVVGSEEDLEDVVAFQCEGLGSEPQLMDLSKTMAELDGWVNDPLSVADSLKNLWLTVCDMRAKVAECCDAEELCVPMPPTDVIISNLGVDGCTISWTAPSTPDTEDPIEYTLEVWEWDGTEVVGEFAVVTDDTTGTSYVLAGILDPNKYYVVYVRANYENCGLSAPASAYGYMAKPIFTQCITLSQSYEKQEGVCEGYAHSYKKYTITATLRNYATQQILVNSGAPITVELTLEKYDACSDTTTYETSFVVIPTGMSSGTNGYNTEEQEYCIATDACELITRALYCVESISDVQTTICPDSVIEECIGD